MTLPTESLAQITNDRGGKKHVYTIKSQRSMTVCQKTEVNNDAQTDYRQKI